MVTCLAIGMIFARCSITDSFYDPFRLNMFALFCAPLILSIVQRNSECPEYWLGRAAAALFAIILLWSISDSNLATKIVLSIGGVLAALVPVRAVDWVLGQLQFLLRPFSWIGSISYALYAIHMPILFFLMASTLPAPVRAMAFFVITFLIAAMLERVLQPAISRNFRRLLRT